MHVAVVMQSSRGCAKEGHEAILVVEDSMRVNSIATCARDRVREVGMTDGKPEPAQGVLVCETQ